MNIRTDLSLLAGGVLLSLAGVALAIAHDPIPAFVEWGAVALLGAAAGVSIPPSSSPSSTSSAGAGNALQSAIIAGEHSQIARTAAADVTALVAEIRGLVEHSAKPQAAHPTPTPTPAPIVAPGPAEPLAHTGTGA